MPTVSKKFYLTSLAVLLGISGLLVIIGQLEAFFGSGPGEELSYVGALVSLLAAPIMLRLFYKMWSAVQDGDVRTTPAKAVGLLFVPLFNIYWAFQVIWGFAKDYNQYLDRHSRNVERLPEGLFLAYVILSFTAWIPVLGIVLLVANYCVTLVMISKICDAVNALAEMSEQEADKNSEEAAGGTESYSITRVQEADRGIGTSDIEISTSPLREQKGVERKGIDTEKNSLDSESKILVGAVLAALVISFAGIAAYTSETADGLVTASIWESSDAEQGAAPVMLMSFSRFTDSTTKIGETKRWILSQYGEPDTTMRYSVPKTSVSPVRYGLKNKEQIAVTALSYRRKEWSGLLGEKIELTTNFIVVDDMPEKESDPKSVIEPLGGAPDDRVVQFEQVVESSKAETNLLREFDRRELLWEAYLGETWGSNQTYKSKNKAWHTLTPTSQLSSRQFKYFARLHSEGISKLLKGESGDYSRDGIVWLSYSRNGEGVKRLVTRHF